MMFVVEGHPRGEHADVQLVKLIVESPESLEQAVRTALTNSRERVRGQRWAEITDLRVRLSDCGGIEQWQVTVDVAFAVEE